MPGKRPNMDADKTTSKRQRGTFNSDNNLDEKRGGNERGTTTGGAEFEHMLNFPATVVSCIYGDEEKIAKPKGRGRPPKNRKLDFMKQIESGAEVVRQFGLYGDQENVGRATPKRVVKKRSRESHNLELKLDVIRRIEKGATAAEVARQLSLPSTTVRTMYRDADKIRASAERATPLSSKLILRKRNPLLEKMEHLLAQWIKDMYRNSSPLTYHIIMEKAMSLFEELKVAEPDKVGNEEDFKASRGWFHRFRKRQDLNSFKFTGEAVAVERVPPETDHVAADAFIPMLKKVIEEGGYTSKQVFNVDETGLFWKRLPSKTSISRCEQVSLGFKASNDRLTILLGGNAEGDCKLKPLVVYHNENPRAMRHYVKSKLPVLWKSNRRACVTNVIFTEFIVDYCIPFLREYCKKENIEFKILLVLDNAAAHNIDFEAHCPNIKVVFLPPNTASLFQPMEQGVIAAFKAHYLMRIFCRLIKETSGEGKPVVEEFWKKFHIIDCIENIAKSWEDVTKRYMNGVWRKMVPRFVRDFTGFEDIPSLHRDIVSLAKDAGFDEVDEKDVQDVLVSHRENLTPDDLMYLDEQRIREDEQEEEEEAANRGTASQRTLSMAKLRQAFSFVDRALEIFHENDSCPERSSRVIGRIEDAIACYGEIYQAKTRATQQTFLDSLRLKTTCPLPAAAALEPIPSTSRASAGIVNSEPPTENQSAFTPSTEDSQATTNASSPSTSSDLDMTVEDDNTVPNSFSPTVS